MKKLKDERVIAETNKILSPMYFLTVVLLILGAGIKWQFTKEITMYLLEILIISITLGYLLIGLSVKGILFQKARDEHILRMKQGVISKCYGISLWMLITGEFILIFIFPESVGILSIYFVIWFIPAIIVTIYVIKKGLLIWGGIIRAKNGVRELKKGTCIGALLFGIMMGVPYLVKDNRFNPCFFFMDCWNGTNMGNSILFYDEINVFYK